ncbi:MAG: hypothetical protein P8J61_10345 [Gammaproteobacteria bacterium]|nr:hypothetical protein [Gammaproteobacteria bacterium]
MSMSSNQWAGMGSYALSTSLVNKSVTVFSPGVLDWAAVFGDVTESGSVVLSLQVDRPNNRMIGRRIRRVFSIVRGPKMVDH